MSTSAIQSNTASGASSGLASTPANTPTKTAVKTPTTTPAADSSPNALANQSVSLQLLIAQLKNQDPDNPADGTQFVTQLAQFTTLEQTTQSRTDLDQILKALQTAGAAAGSPSAPAHVSSTQS